ncbi:hypothetical protein JHK87_006391 [Glycine soja]|nr:hypothetical protein JHK87_006391 [Glycine soja]
MSRVFRTLTSLCKLPIKFDNISVKFTYGMTVTLGVKTTVTSSELFISAGVPCCRGNLEIGSLREVGVKSSLPATTSTERLEILDDNHHKLSVKIIGSDHRLRIISWMKPEAGWIKCNVYAAIFNDNQSFGVGHYGGVTHVRWPLSRGKERGSRRARRRLSDGGYDREWLRDEWSN